MKSQLGTQLRHLIDLLDGAVSEAYDEAGLSYRPRFTPVMRALMQQEPLTIGQIAAAAGITQPATTQTIALMIKQELISADFAPDDGRQRMISMTPKGRAMLAELEICWQATAIAAQDLYKDLHYPLQDAIEDAINVLTKKSFAVRIKEARAKNQVATLALNQVQKSKVIAKQKRK